MKNVGFTIIAGKTKWLGGVNYIKNLLYAIHLQKDSDIQPILFVGKKIDEKFLAQFEGLAIINREPLFDRMSLLWLIDMMLRDVLGINPFINKLIAKYNLHTFSHSYVYGKDVKCKTINWIPDFQHVHLPQMFKPINRLVRNFRLKRMIKYSDKIILSSYDALSDFNEFASACKHKVGVIHFVSQASSLDVKPFGELVGKYGIIDNYLYLPNQFWLHKDHLTVFKAVARVRQVMPEILLVCSGEMNDHRNKAYVQNLLSYVKTNNLEKNITLLDVIPYQDVLNLMFYANAIVNPSLFEGWSSTVEEAKSMGKFLLLSDINVHREQVSENVDFFRKGDEQSISASIINRLKNGGKEKSKSVSVEKLALQLQQRTEEFGREYLNVVLTKESC
jgi:glycosyltransferase involved in cell wall biosynthesis